MTDKKGFFSKKTLIILLSVASLALAFIYVGTGKSTEPEKDESYDLVLANTYKAELERISASMCTQIHGVETARVNITFDGGMTSVYAKNSEGSMGGTYFSSGGDPLFLKYEYPKVVGCVVVCTGSIGADTELELTKMMSAYLGISSSKIFVGY